MIKAKIKRNGKDFNKIISSLKELSNNKISVGHFEESGRHTSGYLYPELMSLWHFGMFEGGIKRSPLMNFSMKVDSGIINKDLDLYIGQWLNNILSDQATTQLLESVGKVTRDNYKQVFGIVGMFMPPDHDGTPMYETGELKSTAAYKTTKTNTVTEG